jgi:hypothetical protein
VTTDRIRDILRRLSAAGLAVVAGTCLVVFTGHTSDPPWLLGWSGRYLFGAVLPVLGHVTGQTILVLAPFLSVERDRYVALGCLFSGALVSILGILTFPSYVGPVLAVSLGLLAIPLAAYRAFRASEWLLSHVALIVVCLVLVLPDVAGSILEGRRLADPRLPRWTDLFRHRWPDAEPFIGAGGRLHPDLDLDVYTDDLGRPPYHVQTNSAGFRNGREIPLVKKPGELRVLNLGDSFSVGYGVDQERFIGPLLEARWRRHPPGREVSVLNAEVSDPAYGLLYLQRYGIRYGPDLVLYVYVDNDSHQAYLPIGAKGIFSLDAAGELHTHPVERAESNRRVHAAHAQFSQHLYPRASLERARLGTGLSGHLAQWIDKSTKGLRELRSVRIASGWLSPLLERGERGGELTVTSALPATHTAGHLRLVEFGSNWGTLYKKGHDMVAPLYANLFRLMESMHTTATNHGAVFVFVYVPRREQVQARDWQRFRAFWNLDPDDFDLDLEASTLRGFCDEKGIPFVDTTAALRAAGLRHNLYLAKDAHFNEHGQAAAAEAIFELAQRYR